MENNLNLETAKRVYADNLRRLGMELDAALVRKYTREAENSKKAFVFPVKVAGEHRLFSCSLCSRIVKGVGTMCGSCGHGGHARCLSKYFPRYATCPEMGCVCQCATQG